MKRAVIILCLALACRPAAASGGTAARFMTSPTIAGDTIVFTYEGDLWAVSAGGGAARRLTAHPGSEDSARFSPDGKWIAFRAQYEGGPQVYVIPATGGTPARVTWFGGENMPVGWTPDGKKIVFRSSHENTFRPIAKLFAVTTDGGYPEPLPPDRATLCAFSPDGTRLAYTRKGNEEYYWKRYKGGQYVDLWLYDFRAKQFTPLTDYVGKNAYPMYAGGKLFFVSDRGAGGVSNIYTIDAATKKVDQVTRFTDFDVQMPSTDGKRIVFVHAGRLNVLDPATGDSSEVAIEVATDRWRLAPRTVNPREMIQSMAVSNDGKTAVFEARGDVFLVPADDAKPTVNLTKTTASRERLPQLSPDGKRVAFFSDKSGEYQLYLADTGGDKPWEQLTTTLDRLVYHLEWSPDGTKILFGDKDYAIWYLDVATRKLVKIASSNQMKNDEFFWEVSDYSWSPDSKWVAYSFVQYNRNNEVFLYSLEQNKVFPVTNGFYDSMNPSFDANGDYLYYLCYSNFDTRIDIFEDNHVIENPVRVMAVQLKAGQKPPFEPGAREGGRTDAQSDFRIDLSGLAARTFPLPVPAGNYFFLKAGKGTVTYASIGTFGESEIEEIFKPGGADKWTLHLFDLSAQKDVPLDAPVIDWRLSANREHLIMRRGNGYLVTSVEKALAGPKTAGTRLSLDRMAMLVKPVEEWTQILDDTYRWYRDFFYDRNMHGRNWKTVTDGYRAMIPDLSTRAELNWLLSQMVGELNVSHTYVGGGDTAPSSVPQVATYPGLLGADLETDAAGHVRFKRILGPTEYNRDLTSPLGRPDIDVKPGDYLVAIDGRELKPGENPYRYLQVTSGQHVKIAVNAKPAMTGARTYDIEPVRSESALRYNRWMSDNVDKVLATTKGDIGYMHITAMGASNVGQFDKFWRAFRYKKGLVIDVRGNGGGWTEYFLIDKLERKMVAYNNLRDMEAFRYPGSVTTGPIAVLTNEYNGSDGEAFIEHFKARKLGTVIGVPSWGGLVGILNRQLTIDNGTVEQSNNAFYGESGQWLVEGHGADPDIVLDNDPASVVAGRDLQLERAIDVLQKQITEKPFAFPVKPKYPVR